MRDLALHADRRLVAVRRLPSGSSVISWLIARRMQPGLLPLRSHAVASACSHVGFGPPNFAFAARAGSEPVGREVGTAVVRDLVLEPVDHRSTPAARRRSAQTRRTARSRRGSDVLSSRRTFAPTRGATLFLSCGRLPGRNGISVSFSP